MKKIVSVVLLAIMLSSPVFAGTVGYRVGISQILAEQVKT